MRYAIKTRQLGKSYTISHQRTDHYQTLRDSIMHGCRGLWHRVRHPLSPNREILSIEQFWALRGVTIDIAPGERVGIIGRNGAGKSTLLKILSRITAPTEGRVLIRGRVAALLEVGTGFHRELTGRENIFLNGSILGMSRREIAAKFDEIVAFAEVEKFLDTPVKRYSSGMYVRLAFAVAAHLEPDILLIDEVLAVGDAAFQQKCLEKMEQISREGRTVLFVSHNLAALQRLCAKAVWFEEGEVRETGNAAQVINRYVHTAMQPATERIWESPDDAPGNGDVRIRKVFVRPDTAGGQQYATLRTGTAIDIGVCFWVLKPCPAVGITLHVITENGIIAFTASSLFDERLQSMHLEKGLHEAVCRIPPCFLNSRRYSVRVAVVQNQARVNIKLEEALVFDVHPAAEQQGAFVGKRPGAVAPILSWTVEKVGQAQAGTAGEERHKG